MPNCFLLVLERLMPCMDVYQLCMSKQSILDELLDKIIMLQVENILFNFDSLDIKLIDFGCGDLWQDTPYVEYAETPDSGLQNGSCNRSILPTMLLSGVLTSSSLVLSEKNKE
ncbi:uncharacterized protein LOC108269550 isoform X1 [Tachysurus ichikawai]